MTTSKSNRAYLAGLLDGEGYISILKTKKGNKATWNNARDYVYVPVIKVAMTDRPIIEWLHQSFGGTFEIRKAQGNRKESYCWTARKKQTADFLQLIHPYLRVKKPQATLLLQYRNVAGKAGHKLTEETWKKRDELYTEIRKLNKRGAA